MKESVGSLQGARAPRQAGGDSSDAGQRERNRWNLYRLRVYIPLVTSRGPCPAAHDCAGIARFIFTKQAPTPFIHAS